MTDLDRLDAARLAALRAWTEAAAPRLAERDAAVRAVHDAYEKALSAPEMLSLWRKYVEAHEALYVARAARKEA